MTETASQSHFGLAISISIEALKSLLLVNGGAATALIALSDKTAGGPKYNVAVLLFGTAALLNALIMVLGYFSQLAYANHCLSVEKADDLSVTYYKRHGVYQWIAIAVLIGSLFVSAAAMYSAFGAVDSVNPHHALQHDRQ